MKDYIKLYCKKSETIMSCKEYSVVASDTSRFLSYGRYYNNHTVDNNLEIYVKLSTYNMIKKNYETISSEELCEILDALKEIHRILPKKQKNLLLEKANLIFRKRDFNLDFFVGLLVDDSIVFFNDSQDETMIYRKSVIRR